jgi:antitoxin ParD1/3/4
MINHSLYEAETMTSVRKTITVTDQQDGWIKAQIQAGHYTNDSEYIRDLIRREQERAAELDAIRAALIEGENSGAPEIFDAIAFKQRMLCRHG